MKIALERAEGVVVAGRYRLVRKLGAGGMGSVWLAHDLSLDSSCALKLIDDEKARNEEVRLRFEREAKAAAQLRGAHVVDVFDHGEWEGMLYIAMEYLQGEDLGARLDRVGTLDGETTYRIVAQVARALVRAHANGIVHRDLKPENIFLVKAEDEEEIAKVLDFGIAKHDAYSLQDKATRTGSFLGTPFYVSPEQARGKSIDHRSDLWSLGIITFQCLTGRPPFESEALGELMGLILYEDMPRPTLRNPLLPAAIDAWWEKAAARDREQRFQSAKELSDALGEALRIARPIAVPSVPPRRAANPDGSGAYPSRSASDSVPPYPPGTLAGLREAMRAGGSSEVPSAGPSEELTDAPVSRTRHSAIEAVAGFSASGVGQFLSRLKEQRKRTLLIAGASGGLALGMALTLVLLRADPSAESAAPAGAPALGATPGSIQEPTARVSPLQPAAPVVPPPPSAAPSAEAAPVDPNSLPTESAPAKPEKKKPPVVRRKPVRAPDYGI